MTSAPGVQNDPEGAGDASSSATTRLPDALRLGHVRLQVSDLARSLEYYSGVLGLHLQSGTERTATLGVKDDADPLVELEEVAGTIPLQQHSRQGLYHFAILLPDRPALGRFLGHLARTGTRIGASDHLVSEAIYLRDPDGLGIEVYADRPRSTWRRVQGQIEMSTAPLDAESVLAAADDAPWTGMPMGTVMGHMHLHVSDLEVANRFYHEALGFDRTVWNYPGALFLSAGGYHHHLGLNTWAGVHAPSASERDARLLEWRLRFPSADDANAAARRLADAGHATAQETSDWLVTDPWGTRLRLTPH